MAAMTGERAESTLGDRADLCGASDWLPIEKDKMGKEHVSLQTYISYQINHLYRLESANQPILHTCIHPPTSRPDVYPSVNTVTAVAKDLPILAVRRRAV